MISMVGEHIHIMKMLILSRKRMLKVRNDPLA
jgi:hypothetical protein